ncbi:MAG: hypothetical protein ACXU8U_11005 [Asticcacaulis sp.]|jgi:hypothetical protein
MMKLSASTIASRIALAGALLAASAIAALPAQAAGPTYSWSNVKVGGSGYVTGMIAHPLQRGLFYNLFYGSANAAVNAPYNGLWKSVNGGDTSNNVPNFPALSNDDDGAGVAFLAVHKGSNWNKPPGSPTAIIWLVNC